MELTVPSVELLLKCRNWRGFLSAQNFIWKLTRVLTFTYLSGWEDREEFFVKYQISHKNKHWFISRRAPYKKAGDAIWDFGDPGCRGWIDNILEDDSLGSNASLRNSAQQEVRFLAKSSGSKKWERDVVDASSFGEKLNFLYFSWMFI